MRNHINNLLVILLSLTLLTAWPAFAHIRLATTTSTESSGLLKALLPDFEFRYGERVHVIGVGTGKALRLGENCDVDVVLVHSRPAEDEFVAKGHGVNRWDVMHNDFILVGPEKDPAEVRGKEDVVDAFKKIAGARAKFVSRGDDSGTHKMEQSYWKVAEITPKGAWYISAGQGMGKVLMMSSEMQAYTLTDRGTYIPYEAKTGLEIVVEGDPRMFNPYGIMAVNPKKCPDVNYKGAMDLINWITSSEGQRRIADFKVEGQQLFFPNAVKNP